MGRDLAFRMFARAGAVLGLAAITAMSYTGFAGAAPADRGDDPVVLEGSQLASLEGADPGKLVAFKWNGKWVQIPVQVDERHTISARTLYPEDSTSKYITAIPFDVEVYADPKTRSGADADKGFDADDELVFMGADSGTTAPSSAIAPAGVITSSATRVTVDDPVSGGNSYVYLFNSGGQLDQSAGRDYVDYDFKLTKLKANENMKDDYGYSNSTNPEDSTVKTSNYELHSTGRWMEDELKISAGGASDADILDREAVSAGGLNGCGRSEYTFSGNWLLDASTGNDAPGDDDDEGTYVAVIDGPVRAIRDFMGANSGPYVESIHKYYAGQEDKTIKLRVHPIPSLFAWTDYSDAATGMTYRDQLNEAGVTVDGNPDSLAAPAPNSIVDGQYSWQQVTGSQGSVTTLVSAQASNTDRFDHRPGHEGEMIYDYTNYYLDDTTPTGNNEKQCGGDLKSYGASGVGITGVFPNSDPVLAGAFADTRSLTLSRIRYFGGPGATAAQAASMRDRAQQPLAGSASKASVKERMPSLRPTLKNRKVKAKRGKKVTLKVKVTNTGNIDVKSPKICPESASFSRTVCKKIAKIAVGKSKVVVVKPRVKKNARGKKLRLQISYVAPTPIFGISGHGPSYSIALR